MKKEAKEGLDQFLKFMKSPEDAVNHLMEIGVLRDDFVLSEYPKVQIDCPECDGVGVKADSLPCCQKCGGTGKKDITAIREKLASLAHDIWSEWMEYLFSQCETTSISSPKGWKDKFSVIPGNYVRRWKRQMETKYQDLPEEEKSSDRDQADKILGILRGEGK